MNLLTTVRNKRLPWGYHVYLYCFYAMFIHLLFPPNKSVHLLLKSNVRILNFLCFVGKINILDVLVIVGLSWGKKSNLWLLKIVNQHLSGAVQWRAPNTFSGFSLSASWEIQEGKRAMRQKVWSILVMRPLPDKKKRIIKCLTCLLLGSFIWFHQNHVGLMLMADRPGEKMEKVFFSHFCVWAIYGWADRWIEMTVPTPLVCPIQSVSLVLPCDGEFLDYRLKSES